jgi:hypothetical protein
MKKMTTRKTKWSARRLAWLANQRLANKLWGIKRKEPRKASPAIAQANGSATEEEEPMTAPPPRKRRSHFEGVLSPRMKISFKEALEFNHAAKHLTGINWKTNLALAEDAYRQGYLDGVSDKGKGLV